ncbi:MAG: 16S rRNA (guanine(527)-N(7))-methyltransferase RsmG [Bacillota bacterium]
MADYSKIITQHMENLCKEQIEAFNTYMNALLECNKMYNLTAITEPNDVVVKHFLDSVQGAQLIPEGASVIDIGSGAGFPAIPLKIVRDDIAITMMDSVGKKVDFLHKTVEKLALCNATAIHMRAEEAAGTSMRESFDVAVSRAVGGLNGLLEYTTPLVKVGGYFIAYKGANAKDELDCAKGAIAKLNLNLVETIEFKLAGEYDRTIYLFKKMAKTHEKYPRPYNQIKTKPL